MCCNFWEKCMNSHKIGQRCSTPLSSLFIVAWSIIVCWLLLQSTYKYLKCSFICKRIPYTVNHLERISQLELPGGALTLESGTWMCPGHDPFFRVIPFSGQLALSLPIYHQCAAHVLPIFNFKEKFSIFSCVLTKISALKMQIFQSFVPKTLHFSRKIHSLDPTFGNSVANTHQKKKRKKSWVPLFPPPPASQIQRLDEIVKVIVINVL